MLRTTLILSCLLLLTGCFGPYTRAQFEADRSPWLRPAIVLDEASAENDWLTTVAYPGVRPEIEPDTGIYRLEKGMRVIRVDRAGLIRRYWWQRDGEVVFFRERK